MCTTYIVLAQKKKKKKKKNIMHSLAVLVIIHCNHQDLKKHIAGLPVADGIAAGDMILTVCVCKYSWIFV